MQAGALAGQELADRRVVAERLEQLDVPVADVKRTASTPCSSTVSRWTSGMPSAPS